MSKAVGLLALGFSSSKVLEMLINMRKMVTISAIRPGTCSAGTTNPIPAITTKLKFKIQISEIQISISRTKYT